MLLLLPVAVLAYAALPAGSSPVRGAPRCELFPRDNHWNIAVARAPVHPRSDRIMRSASTTAYPIPRQARVVLDALKRHRMIVADNGLPRP